MPRVSELLLSSMMPGSPSVRTSAENLSSPCGPDRFLRYLTAPPLRNTLSGSESPSTSTSASSPSPSLWLKPTFSPTEPDLVGDEPTPT
jgi:hypothetical protein